MKFESVAASFDFPASEQRVLSFWKENAIYEKTLAHRKDGERFVFFEGPPTANGLPHPGHVLTRVIKDLMPRYKTMRGYFCHRKAGWDTHGLPVEIEVEKELGIDGKEQIVQYGVEPFVRKCLDSVFRYVRQWEQLTERIGFWIDMSDPYVTCSTEYVESVWWALSEIFKADRLYRGHKIVPYCPRCGTVLSSHEVGLGYQDVDDPSVYVAFKTKADPKTYFLAWTTTPWTLISNAALVVKKEITYVKAKLANGDVLILAEALVASALGKLEHEIVGTMTGAELVGMEYEPLYSFAKPNKKCHFVIEADFVTLDTGTGIVHCAPAFGADDYQAGVKYDLPMIQMVDAQGRFVKEVTPWAGTFIKQADPEIIRDLKERGLLLRRETYRHSYPFCWRCETPLMYYARQGWFIRTTEIKDKIIASNKQIRWLPEHIRDGRFGNFLEDNIDWALSRERFWGTPLPVWVCEESSCGHMRAFSSREDLLKANPHAFDDFNKRREEDPTLAENMVVHKPFIDQVTVKCDKCGGVMRRTSEVIDCWFDSGCMPFAQWGYPHRNKEAFENRLASGKMFPADFISEAIDQTRGWFYSLLAVSTLVFGESREIPHPYKTCIVLGLLLGKDGKKLSKRLRNYDEPGKILDREGADAMRWYFYVGQPPWTSARFDEAAIAESQREFLIRLHNVYSFFVIYANIDGFDPSADGAKGRGGKRAISQRCSLDRWIIAELNRTIDTVTKLLDDYQIHQAACALSQFVDGLSNWYVRRSRNRFWKSEMDADKFDAYWTLYECLTALSRLIAPFTPFFAETMYQNLERHALGASSAESVHLCDWPKVDVSAMDAELLEKMELVREIVALGRSARAAAKIRTRQPLGEVELVLAKSEKAAVLREYLPLMQEELNVKTIHFVTEAREYVEYVIKPNFRVIGPKFGALGPKIKSALTTIDAADARAKLVTTGAFELSVAGQTVSLTSEDIEIGLSGKPGFAAAQGPDVMVVLKTEISEALQLEGVARELVHHIQQIRKEMNLAYEARIAVTVAGDATLGQVIADASLHATICSETLATSLTFAEGAGDATKAADIDGAAVRLWISV